MKNMGSLFILLVGFTLGACSVDQSARERSQVRFSLPESFSGTEKVSGLAEPGSVPCFAVSVRGNGVPEAPGKSCTPPLGEFIGWVQGGEEIALDVPMGKGRSLELFYVGSQGCQFFDKTMGMSSWGSNRIHRLALVKDIDIDKPQVQIQVPVVFPHASNTLDTIYNYPTTCRIGEDNISSVNREVSQVSGAVRGSFPESGTHISLRMAPVTVQVSGGNHSSVRLKPLRLGVRK